MSTHYFTAAEATAFVKAAKPGTEFALCIRNEAPVVTLGEHTDEYFPGALSGYMDITKVQALRLPGHLLTKQLEARGARFPIRVHVEGHSGNVTYWLGA